MIYTYASELWCKECGDAIRETATLPEGANPDNESSYDSGDYPKPFYGENWSNSPDHCAAGEKCFNAIPLPSTPPALHRRYVGPILKDRLTREGVQYVAEAIKTDCEDGNLDSVTMLWFRYFQDELTDALPRSLTGVLDAILPYYDEGY